MARRPRIDFPGAFHHVMNRGAARQTTYKNEWDRGLFLEVVERSVSRFGIEVIAFALMGNHYHLFLHSPDGQLSPTMQYIGRAYTQAFNSIHGRDGALFRGRFHSVLVDSEAYFGRLIRYIELNPVQAGACSIDELQRHEWSSFRYSSGLTSPPHWLSTDHVHRFFGSSGNYKNFASLGVEDFELSRLYDGSAKPPPVLGSNGFLAEVARKHPEVANHLPLPSQSVQPWRIESLLLEVSGATPQQLFESSRPVHPVRRAAIVLSHAMTKESRNILAERYGFSSNTTFLAAVQRERAADSPKEVAWLIDTVAARLQP